MGRTRTASVQMSVSTKDKKVTKDITVDTVFYKKYGNAGWYLHQPAGSNGYIVEAILALPGESAKQTTSIGIAVREDRQWKTRRIDTSVYDFRIDNLKVGNMTKHHPDHPDFVGTADIVPTKAPVVSAIKAARGVSPQTIKASRTLRLSGAAITGAVEKATANFIDGATIFKVATDGSWEFRK